ncbi:MAG: hypothetical protein HPM95_08435 [Alphaproteobacteria bacterium]|nr:hypothetical protein [Alphaproteobacteria bacterium]
MISTPIRRPKVIADEPAVQPYIPPVAETATQPTRMPSIEDFPPVAQREMRAHKRCRRAAP